MKNRRTFGIVGTLIVHLSVLAVVLGLFGTSHQPPLPPSGITEVTLLNVGQTITPIVPANGQTLAGDRCPSKMFYEGVGVVYASVINVIEKAPETLPGYIAGLRVGDIIENASVQADSNGYKTFHIFRNGESHLVFTVKIEKICYEEVKKLAPKEGIEPPLTR